MKRQGSPLHRSGLVFAVLALFAAATARAETPLTAPSAVALALERNPSIDAAELAVASARIAETRAALDRVSARIDVTGGASAGVTKPWDAPATPSTSAVWDARGSASVPLTTGGRVRATLDRAALAVESAELDARATRRDLARAAYTAYWNVVGFELQIRATEEGIAAARQALEIIRSKGNVGLAAGVDVNRSTVDLLSQQDLLVEQRAARRSAEIDLARLLHLGDERITVDLAAPTPASGSVSVAADALSSRPELARQRVASDGAAADVRLARSGALPTVALNAEAGVGAAAANTADVTLPTGALVDGAAMDPADVVHPAFDASIGITLTWNPFDLLRVRHDVERARLQERQIEAANVAERDQLEAELRAAAVRVETLRERYPLVDQQLALARDNQAIVQDLYAQGSATILDLFNAQTAFRSAAIQQASLTVDLATAELDLAWLMGSDTPGDAP